MASGGATKPHSASVAVAGEMAYIACGDSVFALTLPELDLDWVKLADTATCFGIYYSREHECLFSHGECEVRRMSMDGDVTWESAGPGPGPGPGMGTGGTLSSGGCDGRSAGGS